MDILKHSLNDQIHQLNNAIANTKAYEDDLKFFDKLLGSLMRSPEERGHSEMLQLKGLRTQIEKKALNDKETVYNLSKNGIAMPSPTQKTGILSDTQGSLVRNKRFVQKEVEKSIPLRDTSLIMANQGAIKGELGKPKAGRPVPIILQHYQENI